MTDPRAHDPRVRLREALRELVRDDPAGWSLPSLEVFRNRLLDRTGSDYRPYAELLTEAARRGWCQRLAQVRAGDPRWDGLLTPFVMHWSAERFVQPDMARWAAECWGVALGVIEPERVRVAPPAPPPPARPAAAVASAAGSASTGSGGSSGGALPGSTGGALGTGTPAGRRPWRPPTARVPVATAAASSALRATPAWMPRGAPPGLLRGAAPINPQIPRLLLAAVGVLTVAFGIQVAGTPSADGGAQATALAPARGIVQGNGGGPRDTPAAPAPLADATQAAPSPSVPGATSPPASSAAAPGSPAGAGGPGIPSLTGTLLPVAADGGRLHYVQPPRRAGGEGARWRAPTPATSAAYDELHLADGEVWRGTVEVVRAGTVLFRDRRTGLRHEVRKEAVDFIITEFGSTVRFRAPLPSEATGSRAAARVPGGTGAPAGTGARLPTSRPRRAADLATPRGRGVGGAYAVRFGLPQVEGSSACRDAWRREPGSLERAEVRHEPGADTLVVAFLGGDTFPSTIDPDGFFASTFRIVPDQARSSTALTTRLTGRFEPGGALAVTVNLVFYRRLRTGEDIACAVAIPGRGTREPADGAPPPAPPSTLPRRR